MHLATANTREIGMVLKQTKTSVAVLTLAIDIGGTGVKLMVLDERGRPICNRLRLPTPEPATPKAVIAALNRLKVQAPAFDRVGVGFPGVIKKGTTLTAANLHPAWIGFPLQATLEHLWRKPVRVANDGAVQGYGAIRNKGVELVITLGTGMGSALFSDGHLCPGLELGHHPWLKKTYEDYLGKRGLEKHGRKRWNKFLGMAIEQTAHTFNWDTLYIGGGNSKKVSLEFSHNIKLISNEDGLLGAVKLWEDQV
jgi:polyphosphate glucokinase